MTKRFSPVNYEIGTLVNDLEEKLMFEKPVGKYVLYDHHHMTVVLYNKSRKKVEKLENENKILENNVKQLEAQLLAYNNQTKKAS